jgi:DNA-binding transcriptional LysR family regulator
MRGEIMASTVAVQHHALHENLASLPCLIVMAELPLTGLRVLREVADRGSFTAAARGLGYTQSAVSRQVAALEDAAGRRLFERRRDGTRLTPAGGRLLARATTALAELDAARRELDGLPAAVAPVRLGAFASAGAALVPTALSRLARAHPQLEVTLREGTTPSLVRALRTGAIDLALLASSPPFRPFDAEAPPLHVETLSEAELRVAVGPGHPLAARDAVELAELEGQRWVASRSEGGETLLGVWPGLAGRPQVAFVVRDWLAKLSLVAAGLAVTTVPAIAAPAVPAGVRLVAVRGEPEERRRAVLARLPGPAAPELDAVAGALRAAVVDHRLG